MTIYITVSITVSLSNGGGSDCHKILQPLLASHLATTLKISQNSN